MTVDQIVSAVRALPVPERLRVIGLVAHEAVSEVSAVAAEAPPEAGVTLVERHGLLLVGAGITLPVDAFDHRPDRDARADHVWAGS